MARYGSGNVGFVLVQGYDITGDLTDVETTVEGQTVESTTLGDTVVENTVLSLDKTTISLKGYYSDGDIDDAMEAAQGTHPVICFGLEGNTNGLGFLGHTGPCEYKMSRVVSVGDLVKANIEFNPGGSMYHGLINQPWGTVSLASDEPAGSVVDNGASSANGGYGFLQCEDFTGAASLTVKLRHSSDNSTYVDLITFTNVTTAHTAESKSVSSTVNRYTRIIYTFNTPTAQSAKIFVGFARG